jgi:hypothetical protein
MIQELHSLPMVSGTAALIWSYYLNLQLRKWNKLFWNQERHDMEVWSWWWG